MSQVLNVALVGFPNSGKTTLYNWLTGSKFKAVNYPGSTTEYFVGSLQAGLNQYLNSSLGVSDVQIIDTPGTYSFDPKSADELVTYKIVSSEGAIKTDLVALVIDATQLDRQLVLAKSLIESQTPFFIILSMSDLVKKDQFTIDSKKLSEHLGGVPVTTFEGLLGSGIDSVVRSLFKPHSYQFKAIKNKTEDDFAKDKAWIKMIVDKIMIKPHVSSAYMLTRRLDQWLLHPIFGYVFFIVAMSLVFASIYWVAQPFMDFIDTAFGALAEKMAVLLPGLLGQFLSEGVIAALGGVVIFVPQIFILFSLIYILEASGYLARVATLIDKPMRFLGLGGRSFVPMLSGFGCAIPAIIATRNISSTKERRLAQMLIPLLTCSARIPVYSLIISFLFKDDNHLLAGFVMACLYLGSLVISALASGVISRLLPKSDESYLLMDLPLYRRPQFKIVFLYALDKAKMFLKKAGPVIFVLSVVLWGLTTFPRSAEDAVLVETTYAAMIGQTIEPVFKPMGLDWRAGFGIISAFAAREVFVSSMALVFNAEGEDDAQTHSLLDKMHNATWPDGRPLFTVASSMALLVFFMIAMQCMATFAILKKESGSFILATVQLIGTNLLAYVLAVMTYTVLS